MNQNSLYFIAPGQVEIREEPVPELAAGQVLVQSLLSAISPGTELLVYHGQFPTDLAVDETIGALPGVFGYPLKYGYSTVGRVIALGDGVDPTWQDRLVFAFQPHTSHFLTTPDSLFSVPVTISPEAAVFLPNMETAVNFVMDGRPVLGERVAVFGQGIIGLLTTALLAQFPLERLATFDCYPLRRQKSLETGASDSQDPEEPLEEGVFDLVFELSGAPRALDQAIFVTGFEGRMVIGSWYGQKRVSLDLGGRFHRSRIRLISSQVSTLAAEFSGRWTKARRFEVAWAHLRRIQPERFITHQFPITQAADAYRLLDQQPGEAIQVVLTYPS